MAQAHPGLFCTEGWTGILGLSCLASGSHEEPPTVIHEAIPQERPTPYLRAQS